MIICEKCKRAFRTSANFDQHPCVTEAMKLSPAELLKRLYESGGCDQAFYERELAKLQ
jgi:hypothetical protein